MAFSTKRTRRRWLAVSGIGLLLGCVFSIGCGHEPGSNRPRGDSTVTITYDGQPIFGVVVSLDDLATGEGGGGISNAEGVAPLGNVVRGTYKVTLRPPTMFPPSLTDAEKKTIKAQDWATILPGKFRRLDTTTLEINVREDTTAYDFDLKKKNQ